MRIDHYASYKDPSAKVFFLNDDDANIYRQLDKSYLKHYEHFKNSGLAAALIKKNLLIPFEEFAQDPDKIILIAEKISFISYPYEWTFNQWKDAALLTLKVQYHALKFGMFLKDATPFNVVFKGVKPFFVDISSFEIYDAKPWKALKQFSENFYILLLLHRHFNAIANNIYLANTSGIALNQGLAMLPLSAKLNLNTLLFLALPNKIRQKAQPNNNTKLDKQITQKRSLELAERLFSNVTKINKVKKSTKWNAYYEKDVDRTYLKEKEKIIKEWFNKDQKEKTLIDFGCNTGNFSFLLSPLVKHIIAFDEDIYAADDLYLNCHKNKIHNIYTFSANLSNPTPATGWGNKEYHSLVERLTADVGLALALVHHLAITNYINFTMMATLFAQTCNELVIEFVPKEDEKVQLLLSSKQDIFDWYNMENFMKAFEKKFFLSKKYTFINNRVLVHFIKK